MSNNIIEIEKEEIINLANKKKILEQLLKEDQKELDLFEFNRLNKINELLHDTEIIRLVNSIDSAGYSNFKDILKLNSSEIQTLLLLCLKNIRWREITLFSHTELPSEIKNSVNMFRTLLESSGEELSDDELIQSVEEGYYCLKCGAISGNAFAHIYFKHFLNIPKKSSEL